MAKRQPVYSTEGEVAMIAGALTVALDESRSESLRRNLIKDARLRAYRLWRRLEKQSRISGGSGK